MESRRINLLAKGYLSGRLSFEYTQPLSRLRENYILSKLESEVNDELLKLRVLTEASILSAMVPHKKELIDVPFKALRTYSESVLPYLYKKDNIRGGDQNKIPVSKEEKAQWMAMKKAQLEEAKEKYKNNKKVNG